MVGLAFIWLTAKQGTVPGAYKHDTAPLSFYKLQGVY
jgi:hypothetical protein